MRNIENKVIAAAMVVFCLLMAAMVFITYEATDKACNCEEIIPAGIETINQSIETISHAKDSILLHSDTTADGSYRELLERYRRHDPE